MAGCQNCCYGWGILDCFPASMEACFALVVVFVVIFAILGVAYGFLAATMGIQRIWQRHYHILTKRELTKVMRWCLVEYPYCYIISAKWNLSSEIVFSISFDTLFEYDAQYAYFILYKYLQEYVVEDLQGCYVPPKLDPEHESRLKMLKLLWFPEQICKNVFLIIHVSICCFICWL